MRKIEFSDEQVNDIIEMYINYIPVKDIANKYCVNKQVIYKVIKNNNVELHGGKRVLSDEQINEVITLYNNGCVLQDIANMYNVNRWTIKHCLQENEIVLRDRSSSMLKYNIDENFFDTIDTQEKAYVLGLLWADGCNKTDRHSISLKLQDTDKHILEDIKELMHAGQPLAFYKRRKDTHHDMYSLDICNKHMSVTLEKLGMVGAKSLVLEFPMWLDESLYPSYLRGYVDGDGCIYKQKGQYCVSITSTRNFCTYVQSYLQSIGISSKIYCYNPNGITVSLYISDKNNTKKFLDWIYQDATIYLERKHDLYIQKYC